MSTDPSPQGKPPLSLRSRLLWGILLPMIVVMLVSAYASYQRALQAANTAYDRTLLASAKALGELLSVEGSQESGRITIDLLYAALDPFEADNRSRMMYRVSGFRGEHVAGDERFPAWKGKIPDQTMYSSLVDFYDLSYRGEDMRVAVLLQPVTNGSTLGMATIQVAETLELRKALARDFLWDFMRVQGLAIISIGLLVIWVVTRATAPARTLGREVAARNDHDFRPLRHGALPKELKPLVEAINQLMARLEHTMSHQKRFVRDTAHQLRTPLAVLKTQVQSAQRGDIDPKLAVDEIGRTVEGATQLANQMLDLAKIEQVKNTVHSEAQRWDEIVRKVSLDLAPLIAERRLEFSIETEPVLITTHQWMLQELTRNLLHNAIVHSTAGAALAVTLTSNGKLARLTVADGGPGISGELRERLFQPFSRGSSSHGSGLGLTICLDICTALGGTLRLENRLANGAGTEGANDGVAILGLDAVAELPALRLPD